MAFRLDPATAINDPHGISWGMHPIAWRNDDVKEVGAYNTLEDELLDLADLGYLGTEVAGWYPSKEETKERADARGIKIVAQWFSSFIVRDGIDAVIPEFTANCEYLQYLGATRIVVSEQTGSVQGDRDICIFTNKPVLKDEEWPVLAEGLNRLGDIAHEHGLELVYHHHLGTVVQTKEETIRLMEMTDPSKVSLLFDTGHAFVGDGDVMGLLEATIDRIKHVHFKDVRPEKMEESKKLERSFLDSFLNGMFTVPGDGMIDFTEPYKFLIDHGYDKWILVEAEQDPAVANPHEYGEKARTYIESTLFTL
ncbi:MAG: myo-inosose-2 dehydratase [Actinomyces urogenitalis]|jgi:inosose dehydratase|uniref:AP endonuclease, family 2 n=2 Tax=Actinomyces urogenitalis TaxID=103621 RepID=C0W6M6_9ACTO|nr:myo-inosose-2 dehydratase [Actinomyces urogenitalis]ETJ07579.1 MAG: Myo-inosose-2 dehydratase [Actinomyces urogenitalis DORA_12]EEH65550.1 AP endonuclease, family 2 [Actinomyces urogenitalis DSM 15434]KGE99799.1 inosose dehydratase [Actinomyces urogenitalis S6-C4]MCI7457866.1 myo-inosose-2 dehydratase [Actinomyces urogenitalis]MDK8238558.1 myo-inosose-2 dehydratase [Actinomyces urogenitalis]